MNENKIEVWTILVVVVAAHVFLTFFHVKQDAAVIFFYLCLALSSSFSHFISNVYWTEYTNGK